MLIEKNILQEVINEAASTGCDFVEIFAEDTFSKSAKMIGSKVEGVGESRIRGVGLRLALGYNYVYGYTNDISKESLMKLAGELKASFNAEKKPVKELSNLVRGNHHKAEIMPEDVKTEEIIKLLERADKEAKAYSEFISQTSEIILLNHQKVLIARMDGKLVEDERFHTRFTVSSVASRDGKLENGHKNYGKALGFEILKDFNVEEVARESSRIAITNLNAKECPSGEMPVIIENGFGGVLFHEAVGHSLEATSVSKGLSVFCGQKGKQVAHECVNAFDDGTIEGEWGSETFDDEGNEQKKRQLIKNGVLVSYMVDEINGKRMNEGSTGSSRRQSYKYAPTSRMSNTYIAPGTSTLEEMLKDVKFGLYCKSLGGGSVNPTTGDFNFAVGEGYLIENGKITDAVKGASLVGTGRQVLSDIVMVGDNLSLETGMCGSISGAIPTTVGQPRLKVAKMTVGGRGEKC